MASGTIALNSSKSWSGRIEWVADPDISSNSSTVIARVYMWKTDGYTTGGSWNWPASVSINDSVKDISTVNGVSLGSDTSSENPFYVGEHTVTIKHKSDGTQSCKISASITGPSGTSLAGATLSGEATVELDKISRASTISSANDVTLGNVCSVTWTPQARSMRYKLRFSISSWSYTTGVINPRTTSAYTYTGYIIPVDVSNYIVSSTSGTMSVTLYTYSDSDGSNQVGSPSSLSFVVSVPEYVKPTISTSSYVLDNSFSSSTSSWDIAVATVTRVKLTASASGVYGSQVLRYSITGAYSTTLNGSSLNYTGGIIGSSGNKVFVITCIDSRGRSSDPVTIGPINFLPYSIPVVDRFNVSKDDVSGKPIIDLKWSITGLDGNNSGSATLYYKVSTATDWTTYQGNLTNDGTTLIDIYVDPLKSYNFYIRVVDLVGGEVTESAFFATLKVLLDFKAGGDGLGIGKICESPSMEVGMDAKFFNEVTFNGDIIKNGETIEEYLTMFIANRIYPIGSVYISLSDTDPGAMFGGQWVAIENRFLLGASEEYPVGTEDGEATHVLSVEELPSHTHPQRGGPANKPVIPEDGKDKIYPMREVSGAYDQVTGSTGGNKPHNNMPPYYAVYMWRRVA